MTISSFCYNKKFEGNILIVGQTGYIKTTFIQNIAKNNLFGELKEIFWISKIPLSMEREENISLCFGKSVNFRHRQSVGKFNMELTFFQKKTDRQCCR